MRSETSEDMHEAQPYEEESPVDALKKAKDFLAKLKDKFMASRLGSEIEALCLGKINKLCSLRNYVKILVYFNSYVVRLPLRILTCLIYDWADHRQGSAHWNKRRSPGRSATRQLGSAIFMPSVLHSFHPPCSFLPSSVYALPQTPNT
ncbi:hypothetical protein H5410_040855 [Solanum commersonii]|uniref:Uncharacterized protein n=1 Tax=Solanum commersonii TaxID=4109 RepID=A0A9J5XRC3_SOLCO|nr:hypothetical protein H5410_040855 [Solanum commersonii]